MFVKVIVPEHVPSVTELGCKVERALMVCGRHIALARLPFVIVDMWCKMVFVWRLSVWAIVLLPVMLKMG